MRALESGDVLRVRSAAAELPHINLGDALRICMVFRTAPDPGLLERAAVRWIGRFCLEAPLVQLSELEQVAVALGALREHPEEAYGYLKEVCSAHGIRIARTGTSGGARPGGQG